MICSKCGANNLEGQTICGSCGSPLSNSTSTYNAEITGTNTISADGYSNSEITKPKSYQTESIIVTVVSMLCCGSFPSLIIGIIAIVKASKVDSDFASGNVHDAIQNSKSAKNLTIWAAVVAVIWVILFSIFYFVILAAVISAGGGLENLLNL
jgi:uncharacterized membrane protein YvbJ